jgi:hypothetical protein|tara:strand:+ start:216 stop:458 length:243 start_codon:yes stop_codon:yes gene_type:complete
MEDSHIDNILKQIDLETSSVDAGHEAYNKAISGKKFNQNYLENVIADHDDPDLLDEVPNDHISTFDEANPELNEDRFEIG